MVSSIKSFNFAGIQKTSSIALYRYTQHLETTFFITPVHSSVENPSLKPNCRSDIKRLDLQIYLRRIYFSRPEQQACCNCQRQRALSGFGIGTSTQSMFFRMCLPRNCQLLYLGCRAALRPFYTSMVVMQSSSRVHRPFNCYLTCYRTSSK